jgi:hypothetical protein
MASEKDVINPRVPKKIKYHDANRLDLQKLIKETIPKELIPTKKLGYVFGAIFLIVIIWGIVTFPFGKMMSGNVDDLEIKIGLPFSFLVFNLMNPEEAPIRIGGLIWDLLIYLILSYAVDVAINLFLNSPLLESEEEKKKRPQVFKDQKGRKLAQSNIAAEQYVQKINSEAPKATTQPAPQKKEEAKFKKVESRTTFVKEDGWYKQKEV